MHSTPLIVVLGAILATACAQLESADPVVANHTSVVSGNRPTVHTVDPSEVKFESLQVANVTHNASEPANSDDCASDIGCDVTSIIQSLDRRSFVSAAKKHCLENRYIVFHIATNGERISLETTCPTHSNRGTEIDGAAFLDVLDLLKEPYYEVSRRHFHCLFCQIN